jgi:hypothetical protein
MARAISVGVRPSFLRAAVSCRGVMGPIVLSDGSRGQRVDVPQVSNNRGPVQSQRPYRGYATRRHCLYTSREVFFP